MPHAYSEVTAKLLNDAFYAMFCSQIKKLPWSDPGSYANGHRLINETTEEVMYLEVGDRTPGDEGSYPDDDLKALLVGGKWKFVHKGCEPYG
jgi:hypothetical protein